MTMHGADLAARQPMCHRRESKTLRITVWIAACAALGAHVLVTAFDDPAGA